MAQEIEIWTVSGRTENIWTIPIHVLWISGKRCLVRPAITLLAIQTSEIERKLDKNGNRRGGQWKMTDFKLKRIAIKTTGGDPEQYLSWSGRMRTQDNQQIENDDTRDFLDEFYLKNTQMLSREDLSVFWFLLCQHMAHWVINRERPVDLIRWKIQPSVLRGNWKQIFFDSLLITNLKNHVIQVAMSRGHERFSSAMIECGDAKILRDVRLLAFDPSENICYRKAELEHTPAWWETIRKVELQRYQNSIEGGYEKQLRESAARQQKMHIRLFHQFLAEMACPIPLIHKGVDGKCKMVAPKTKYAAGAHRGTRFKRVFIGRLDYVKAPKEPSAAKCVSVEDGKLPEMPTVQPDPKDVRDSGDRQPSSGLLVLHAGEGISERELLGVGEAT